MARKKTSSRCIKQYRYQKFVTLSILLPITNIKVNNNNKNILVNNIASIHYTDIQ